jgi:hypothetical protein
MGSRFHPRFYDEAKLNILESAFKDVCQTLQVEQADQFETIIAEKLMAFAEIGVIDAKELCTLVLRDLWH